MSRGTPSLAALLGMVAIAGYQNRDKISQWLGTLNGPKGSGGGLGGLLGSAQGPTGGAGWGGPSARGGQAGGFEGALDAIARQTGLSPDEIRRRLSHDGPQAAGRFPA